MARDRGWTLASSRPSGYLIPMRVHLIGIGGVGMSAIAQALLDRGDTVSGSDRLWRADAADPGPVFSVLRAAGARLYPQDGSAIVPDLDLVVASSAIESGNPDLDAAARAGLPVVPRAEMLARLVEGRRLIAVAGTAGKTTVTGMIGWLLESLHGDPLVVNGGELVSWSGPHRLGSVRVGAGRWAVVETDESDRSLLRFHPSWAVITNISKDHFTPDEVERLFRSFAEQTTEGIVAGPETMARLSPAGGPARRVMAPELTDVEFGPDGVRFRYRSRPGRVAMPGRHNAENARLVLALGEALGMDLDTALSALAEFQGVRRRLELIGHVRLRPAGAVPVFDDYAHNSAKIAASWAAIAGGAQRVLGVWRPHGFAPLALSFDELIEVFLHVPRPQDRIFLLPVYYAGGTARGSKTADDLARALRERGRDVRLVSDYDDLEAILRAEMTEGDAVLVMGARDPELPAFCRRLAKG